MRISLQSLITLFVFFITACVSWGTADRGSYPEEWWKPVPREDAAGWEVLPQDAASGEVILSKRNELGIFSNFAATPFELEGQRFASVEGFWQMMKYPENPQDERAVRAPRPWPFTREQVAAMTGFEAKAAGNQANALMKEMGIQWVTFKGRKIQLFDQPRGDFYNIVRAALEAKMKQNPQVETLLRKTGSLVLKPDHFQSADSLPAWKYADLWMEIRGQLLQQPK